ncbi:MAG: sulfatase-like hydrolase/transferase, partial [Mariniblastus sp.]|nr:sulfatase-like hydrolase/transferase [Mariniblastus sp.]
PPSESAKAVEHKNVLLICIDDLRPVMGCYGGAAKTPNLDKLAENATVFTRHYSLRQFYRRPDWPHSQSA